MNADKLKNHRTIVISTCLVCLVLAFAPAHGLECHVDTSRENQVTFYSDAPIDDFEGVTDRIDGYVYWAESELQEDIQYDKTDLYFEVELDALDTGIGLRNRQMKNDYLETEKYPYATFSGKITEVKKSGGDEFLVTTDGELTIHGQTKDYTIECRVNRDAPAYRIRCEFQVSLPDFSIEVPSLMFMKISETIDLELDYYVRAINTEEKQ